jgi:hypothetical protein
MALTSAPSGHLFGHRDGALGAPSATSVTNADGAITPTWQPSMPFVHFHDMTMISFQIFSCNPPANECSHERHPVGEIDGCVEVSGMAFESVRGRSCEVLRTAGFG